MKKVKGNYLQMPRSLVTKYGLSAGELFLYYVLKEFEQRFIKNNKDGKELTTEENQFFTSDEELMEYTGFSHNTLAKHKKGLKDKGLIRVRKRKDNRCDYLLLDLYHK